MALNAYVSQVQRLLNDELGQLYSVTDLTVYVNIARNTIATQSECLIANGSLSTINSQQSYPLSSFSGPSGLSGAVNVRSVRSVILGSGAMLDVEPWPWFQSYLMTGSNTLEMNVPTVWSMQNQGSLGNLWFWPIPNGTVAMAIEAAWTPIALVNDSTQEVLGYPWTDAVAYFAAYLAYLNAQRRTDSDKMLSLFNAFMKAARVGVTPDFNAPNFPSLKPLQGAFDPTLSNLGQAIKPSQGGEGGLG